VAGDASDDHHSDIIAELSRDGDYRHGAIEDCMRDCSLIDGELACTIDGLWLESPDQAP